MFFSVVYLDDMRERCCQCRTKTSKQDQQWVRNMSRSRKELIELIRKKFLIWCFSLFNRLDVIYVSDGFTTLVLAKKKWTTLRKRLIGNVPYVDKIQNKLFRPWEVCSLDDLWSFAASHSLKHFINRCTWKSSQYYIVINRMTSFIRISQKLVFHQSKCICAIKRILSTTAMCVSSSSFMYLRISCYCDACLNSSDLRVGVTTLLNTIQYN